LKLFSRWGYSIDSLVDMFAMAIQCAVGKESLAKFGGVHLVIHDWGSVFGYQLQDRYPHLVKTIVSLDVGPMHIAEKPGLQDLKGWILMGIAYQYWLILAFLIANLIPLFGPSIGKWLTIRTLISLSGGKIKIVSEDDFQRRANGYMNFPYLFLHIGNMLKLLGYSFLSKGTGSSKSGVPKCQIMFIYGTKKKLQFFSNVWLQEIQKIDGNLSKSLDAVHWIQKEAPVEFNELLREWLKTMRNPKL
jgi:pimeloyl-ACP methyl ester carboxylesterase